MDNVCCCKQNVSIIGVRQQCIQSACPAVVKYELPAGLLLSDTLDAAQAPLTSHTSAGTHPYRTNDLLQDGSRARLQAPYTSPAAAEVLPDAQWTLKKLFNVKPKRDSLIAIRSIEVVVTGIQHPQQRALQ